MRTGSPLRALLPDKNDEGDIGGSKAHVRRGASCWRLCGYVWLVVVDWQAADGENFERRKEAITCTPSSPRYIGSHLAFTVPGLLDILCDAEETERKRHGMSNILIIRTS